MKVYKIEHDNKLRRLNENKIKLEKKVQNIVEKNLELIFNIELIKSEFTIKNRRIDTLAFDPEIKSFVIIEYKRDRSKSIVDQGYAYLRLLLEYKADFVLTFNGIKGENKNLQDIDWSQSKIIFITNRFLEYSKEALGLEMPFELWELSKFDDDTLILAKIEPIFSATLDELTQINSKSEEIKKEIKVYDELFHLDKRPSYIHDLYMSLKEEIKNIDENIDIKPTKLYIAFKINAHNFVTTNFTNKRIDLYLSKLKEEFDDPKDFLENVPDSYNWGKICRFPIDSEDQIPYALHLIKQSYEILLRKL
ncbi:hypothetical protein LCGC14_0894660 [marine sediment metagenome]|uniref:DUF5655 domain-containing protein n=1 Tax=marine sediment metagenome TaxID=412755 RepID=A0A0F9P310_9ZZZZ|nr:hypothetical protein [bacterium]